MPPKPGVRKVSPRPYWQVGALFGILGIFMANMALQGSIQSSVRRKNDDKQAAIENEYELDFAKEQARRDELLEKRLVQLRQAKLRLEEERAREEASSAAVSEGAE